MFYQDAPVLSVLWHRLTDAGDEEQNVQALTQQLRTQQVVLRTPLPTLTAPARKYVGGGSIGPENPAVHCG